MKYFIIAILSFVLGFYFCTLNPRITYITKVTYVELEKELIKDLGVSGCLRLPLWKAPYGTPGVQICTYEEIMHRGWIYDKEQVKKRVEERKKNK